MSSFSLLDVTTWVHGYDMTTDLNQVSLSAEVEDLENTTFGSGGFRSRTGGLKSVSAELSGYWQSDDAGDAIDPELWANLAQADRVVTIAPDDAEEVPAFMFKAGEFSFEAFGAVGEVTPFSASMLGTSGEGLIRGQVAKAKASVNATGATGSAVNLGAVGADQFLYATLHVFSPGTTITVQVEGSATAGFTSPTTHITIGPITTAGGVWASRLAGPVTDTYYRFNISAITGTFQIAGAIGIGS